MSIVEPVGPEPPNADSALRSWLQRPFEALFGPFNRHNALTWLKLILLVLAVRWLFVEPFRIPSGSMEPTLYGNMNFMTDDRVAVNKMAYGPRIPFTNIRVFDWGAPKRWDIVVFRSVEPLPEGASALQKAVHAAWPVILIKRVVGLPGERIHIQDGKVYANGEALNLPPDMPPVLYTSSSPGYINGLAYRPAGPETFDVLRDKMRFGILPDDAHSVIPPDSYLLMGDNSGNSIDGRYFGWVPRGHILGRAFGIWWPLPRRRDFTGFSHTWWGAGLLYGIPLAFLVAEWFAAFVGRSWRVNTPGTRLGLRTGDRLWINRRAYGWRVPFSRRRIACRTLPRKGDVVVYAAPHGSEWSHSHPVVGRVAAASGEPFPGVDGASPGAGLVPEGAYIVEPAEGSGEESGYDCVTRDDFLGRVTSVWWPRARRRTAIVRRDAVDLET